MVKRFASFDFKCFFIRCIRGKSIKKYSLKGEKHFFFLNSKKPVCPVAIRAFCVRHTCISSCIRATRVFAFEMHRASSKAVPLKFVCVLRDVHAESKERYSVGLVHFMWRGNASAPSARLLA